MTPYQKALLVSGAVLLVSLGTLFALWMRIDIAALPNIQLYLLGTALFAIGLLVMNIFQSFIIGNDRDQMIAEANTAASPGLFMELYRRSPVPYVLIDTKGEIISANTSTVRLFNTTEGSLDGQNIFDSITGDDPTHVGLFPEKLRRGVFINDEEVRIVRVDGIERWVLFSLFSFTDSRGDKRGLVTFVDITKQKEIDKAKSEFVSLASHQLRTPISAMRWNAELLALDHPETFSESQKEHIDKIVKNLERMDILVGDFLNVSKLELGTLTANLAPVPLEPLVDTVIDEQAGRIKNKHITVKKDLDGSVPTINSDANLLHMVVGNLVSNAAKYTRENGSITIATKLTAGKVAISIADTGMGIPQAEQENLFTKLFRASNAKAEVADGTGLGLYIVKEVVEVLGGTIAFVSEEGVGTTFTVTLPT